ncbi:hypothetical protein [Sphingomonas immobilis]|uniref:Uncharacterized protein n=1 Tax=Sphingomonas immobilis TaxID=3063997 RepID=A0ABT8ZWS8_9SPHN|nr:hypothetical protein [Sphingomonas sp. CA1-15]MDO7841236.1 hypothetical protein [Sphingomonas sp. CA1-15]
MTFARALVFGQTGGIVLALGALAFQPPAHGRMMLIPMTAHAAATLVPRATGNGAALIARGPAGSLIVSGDRNRLQAANILILAAPPAGCAA